MDTTVRSAISAAQNRLTSVIHRRVTTLAASAVANATQITVTSNEGIADHSLIGVGTEVYYVLDASNATLDVLPGFAGSESTTHAEDDVVEVRFGNALSGLLLQRLYAEIVSWPPDLFRVDTELLTTAAGVIGYDTGLTYGTEALRLLRIWKEPDTGDSTADWIPVRFRQIKRGPAALSAGKIAVSLGYVPGTAGDVHLEYAAPFDLTTFDEDTDLVADVGLAASMVEVAYLGAAYRSLTEVPVIDTRSQVESRNVDEIQPGQITGVREDLWREYERRKRQEVNRLLASYPVVESR